MANLRPGPGRAGVGPIPYRKERNMTLFTLAYICLFVGVVLAMWITLDSIRTPTSRREMAIRLSGDND